MPFEAHIVEAKLALDMLDASEMPVLASAALEAGLDGPTIRRLAALDKPSGWAVDQLMPVFKAETNLHGISQEEAAIRVAAELGRRILSGNLDPLYYKADFKSLWIRGSFPSALYELGNPDDHGGRSENEIRKDNQKALLELISDADSQRQS